MFLSIGAHHEGGNVDEALANTDVFLLNKNASVVDRLGEALLVHLGLKAALEKSLRGEHEHKAQLILLLGEKAVPDHAAKKRLAFEKPLGVLLVERKERTGGLTDRSEHELHAPDFALAAKSVLAAELELLIEAFLLKRTTRCLEHLRRVASGAALGHLVRLSLSRGQKKQFINSNIGDGDERRKRFLS